MKSKKNCRTAYRWAIASYVSSVFLPLVGLIFGIICLNTTREKGKEDRDLSMGWVAIGESLIMWIIYFIF